MLVWLLSLDACEASVFVGDAIGNPRLGRIMARVAWREGRCVRKGAHEEDIWASKTMWRKAVRLGNLHPDWCPWHRDPENAGPMGPHGLSYAYTMKYLPFGGCFPQQFLSIGIGSALAATARASWLCENKGACSAQELREYWKGKGNAQRALAQASREKVVSARGERVYDGSDVAPLAGARGPSERLDRLDFQGSRTDRSHRQLARSSAGI